MTERPTVLAIGGSDCAGLAGLQTDSQSIRGLGCHAATVVTANTAQNHHGVQALNAVAKTTFSSQLTSAAALPVQAVKTGLITAAQVDTVAEFVRLQQLPLICDPVLAATGGGSLSTVATIKRLLPLCSCITPNQPEAEALTGTRLSSTASIERAAEQLLAQGAKAVYLKGGHSGGTYAQDFFLSREFRFWLRSPRLHTANTRGTGCAIAAAIAAALARGHPLADAVVIAKMALNEGLAASYALAANQPGPVNITRFPGSHKALPQLSTTATPPAVEPSPNCGNTPLGLYPVVDSANWLQRLLPQGVSTIQLRNKTLQGKALAAEIQQAVTIARRYKARLFINDHWQLAIKHGAYGVHLGQQDLHSADIQAIKQAGLRLGLSTHCHYEVARAQALQPSYIACGPVYATTTKIMPWVPHGLKGLQYWQHCLNYPLVAIGGINANRITAVAATGVAAVAMITAITEATDPEAEARHFAAICRRYCR